MKLYLLFVVFLLTISLAYAAKIDYKVEDSLNKNNDVDVIVYNNLKLDEVQSFNIKYKYNTLNGFSARINKNDLEKLKNDQNVKSVYFDQEYNISLQDSVPLINANIVQSKLINNFNLTGKGETVCVLDTGANYTHPDLGGCFGKNCKIVDWYDYVNKYKDPYDDNGHGTHVAGIIAASGNITGVAPDANLAIIKVCNANGTCTGSDIIAGLDWCISNQKKYNINIISMSLGGGLHSGYCNDDTLAPSVNTAFDNNISVVVSTGNGNNGNPGSNTEISSPACIQNSISVASSNKQDLISDFSNRNNLTTVISPGENINSTWIDGGYRSLSGTSMATPHVSGLIALLQEYKQKESNRELSVSEIKNALKNSDKNITDVTGINYTRINADKALISIDALKPNFTIKIYPNPGNLTVNNVSINFSGQDTNLDKVFVNVSYPNGSLLINSYSNFILTTNMLRNLGNYNVEIFANDSHGNYNLSYYNLTIKNPNLPIVTLNYPLDNSFLNIKLVNFDCSMTEDVNLANVTLYINNIINKTNNVSGKTNNTNFALNLDDGNYIWNCKAYDNSSNSAFSANNFTFTIDTIISLINNVSETVNTNSALINFNTDETTNATIYYNNLSLDDTNFSNSHYFALNNLNSNTLYYYNISSCDFANNCDLNSNNFTTLIVPDNPSSSGSGPGGGSSSRNTVDNIIIPNPVNIALTANTSNARIVNETEKNNTTDNETQLSNEISASAIKDVEQGLTGRSILDVIKDNKERSIGIVVIIAAITIFFILRFKKSL